jgi:hypothetical protein
MNIVEQIMIDYPEETFYVIYGFDDAIIGFDESYRRLVYDIDKVLDILVLDGMTYDDAVKFYDFEILDAYFGEGTPIFVKNYT